MARITASYFPPYPQPSALQVVMDDATEEPTRQLTEVAVEECHCVGSTAVTVNDILDNGGDHKVLKMIQKGIDGVNRKALSRAQKVGFN